MLSIPDGVAREPELLRTTRHDHIVEVWEAQWDPDPVWAGLDAITFVCPYHDGGSVYSALMGGHTFSVGAVLAIAKQVLDALAYLHHEKGYVHRDVKPSNILLDGTRENAHLGDLGSAGHLDPETGRADDYGVTPLYLAPEVTPTGSVTVQSDLFSLGVTLVEMLAGPFPYETLTPAAIDERLASGRRALPDRWYALPPWTPRPLSSFIRSLVNVLPSKRPTGAEEALRTLDRMQIVDWRRVDGDGLIGVWEGTWPPTRRPRDRRVLQVSASPVSLGKYSGQVRLSARWKAPGGVWRNFRSLTCWTPANDTRTLAEIFRKVEAAAKGSPA